MRIALVAMPWATFDMPSPALGALASVIRHDEPNWTVDCHYEYVDVWNSLRDVYEPLAGDERMGELLYAAQLYPENAAQVRDIFVDWTTSETGWLDNTPADDAFAHIGSVLANHIDTLANKLACQYDVVGFTTSYAQLFASLSVSKRLKSLDEAVQIVLGGMGVPHHIGPSVLRAYRFVDVVIQGEGERRFVHLLQSIQNGAEVPVDQFDGIICQRDVSGDIAEDASNDVSDPISKRPFSLRDEIGDLDELPVPDYSEYAIHAQDLGIHWHVPVEASRGCWWDRVKRTGDPKDTCYFCSLNTSSYRHKQPDRIAAEMRVLSERHENLRFFFLDNILRPRGVEALTTAINALNKSFRFAYELRAQIHPREILALKEAGCMAVQIGVEGLSTSYLERIGKGTSVIQNLQAMKTCYELGVRSGSNLLVEFPGATQAEVDETAEVIRRFASIYQPLEIVKFSLYVNNYVFHEPEKFEVENIRNADELAAALPRTVYDALDVYWLDFDVRDPQADWTAVNEAVADWRALHERLTLQDGTEWFLGLKPLIYRDGGTFLEIIDRRRGLDLVTFREPWRSIYLFCTEIRGRSELRHRFPDASGNFDLERGLAALVEVDFMFAEGGSYLSLAVADRPKDAARRIRESD